MTYKQRRQSTSDRGVSSVLCAALHTQGRRWILHTSGLVPHLLLPHLHFSSRHFLRETRRKMASLIRRIVSTTKAPAAIGPYSQAVVVDRTMYISGQLGMDPASGQLVEGGVQAQTRQALVNMGEILKAAGCSYENVVKTTVLLADMNDFTNVNDVYKQFFSTNYPARAAYQVAALPRGGLVEIEAVAVLGPLTDVS
uniref:2-iminobutanoate/2-iminopropanoate deaminase n=2 Tax=Seriola dumerili TaxID=41447 RepID=A0A3B4TWR5_SERDU